MLPRECSAPPFDVRSVLQSAGIPYTVVELHPRDVLYHQGAPCAGVIYIEHGSVRLAVMSPDGREAVCGLLKAGAFLGEEVLAGHARLRHTAIAVTATSAIRIAESHVTSLVNTERAFREQLIAHMVARRVHLEDDLADQLLYGSEQRLARTLLMLAGGGRMPRGRCAVPHVSQEVIAEMVGTTRPRVNAMIGKFKKRGFVETDHGVLLVNRSLMRAIGDDAMRPADRAVNRSS